MRVTVLCVALALFALANSQVPKPCIVPPQWTGRIFQSDRTKNFARRAAIEYDAFNERIAIIEEEETSSGRDFYWEIFLFKEKTGYRINLASQPRTCEKFPIDNPFRPIAIPQNATFLGEFFLGTSSIAGDGILVENWTGNTTNPVGRYDIVVTADACIPINDIFYSEETSLVTTFYYDIIAGIVDPNEFVPPSEC